MRRGRSELWAEPFVPLRVPKLFNLRTDPFERADVTSNTYWDWYIAKRLHDLGGARRSWPSSSRRSRTSRRARRRRASRSTRRSRRWSGRCERGPRLMDEPLASWSDDPDQGGDRRLRRARRQRATSSRRRSAIAVFDNDGTLWCEKPMPVELGFILQRLAAMAEADESLRDRQPWKAASREGPRLARRRDRQALRGRRQRREGPDGRAAAGVRRP